MNYWSEWSKNTEAQWPGGVRKDMKNESYERNKYKTNNIFHVYGIGGERT